MKNLPKLIAITLFTASAALLRTSCESDAVIQEETTRTTSVSPYGYGGASESTTTTTTTVVDD